MADVVAVAEVGESDAVEAPEPLANRHRVGKRLERVGEVGEAVDDRDRGVLGEGVDLCLVECADQERADEAREHERRVPVAFAACEL